MPDDGPPHFPNDTQRFSVIGRTGSGKTTAGLWHLSRRAFDYMPWVIVDTKRDPSIARLPREAREIDVNDYPPMKAGLYIVRPTLPDMNEGLLTDWFMRVWENENTGVFIDETYTIGKNDVGLNSLLTQGRSKHIPMILLSQRPAWISRYINSESEYFQVFNVNDYRDIETMQNFIRVEIPDEMEPYHSFYYDVARRKSHNFKPVPSEEKILDSFAKRLTPKTVYV